MRIETASLCQQATLRIAGAPAGFDREVKSILFRLAAVACSEVAATRFDWDVDVRDGALIVSPSDPCETTKARDLLELVAEQGRQTLL